MDKCPKCGYSPKEGQIERLAAMALERIKCHMGIPECKNIPCKKCPFRIAEELLEEMKDA